MKHTGFYDALTLSNQEVSKRFNQAKRDYIKACKEAPQLRDPFKESLDEVRANLNQTTVECERKKRKTIEKQREAGKALSKLRQKTKPKVSRVFATIDGTRTEYIKKIDIEKACINKSPKQQTNNTTRKPDNQTTSKPENQQSNKPNNPA